MAITEPFTNFSFSRWNFGYHGAFHELFFLTMEFRLSQRLSQTFLSHNGISAITEPFTNFYFSRWNFGYHGAFSWNLGYHGAFLKLSRILSHDGIHKTHNLGKTLFIYITKSIYIGSTSLKTLPLDLEPPLQGKEYGPPYSKLSAKSKCFYSRNHL
jgi:hypothetical protein